MSQPMIVSSEQEDSDGRDPTYFSYYAQFVHQQNMLQDSVRTSLYQTAILANGESFFSEKTVMDLGAGSGILSYFAVKAGARLVYAVGKKNHTGEKSSPIVAVQTMFLVHQQFPISHFRTNIRSFRDGRSHTKANGDDHYKKYLVERQNYCCQIKDRGYNTSQWN